MTDAQQKKVNNAPSASPVDADSSVQAADAAQAESDRYEQRDKASFGGGGRQQAQLDPSYGYSEKRTGK
jgi:hypothetical protein